MQTLKIAILGAALLSPAASFAAYIPAGAADIKGSLTTTLTQDVEGYPNPVAAGKSCVSENKAINNAHGKFMGYRSVLVCN